MPVERRGWVIAFEIGSTGNGRNPIFNGRRQPSRGGGSRMTRECQVRFYKRLGVKFPGAYSALPRQSPNLPPLDVDQNLARRTDPLDRPRRQHRRRRLLLLPAEGVEISTTSGIGGAIVDTKPGDHLLNTCGPRQIDETGRDCALGELPRR